MKPVVTTTADAPVTGRPELHVRELPRGIDPRFIASLASVYLVWSSTYLGVRVAVETMPPLMMCSARFLAAGLVMLGVARHRGAKLPPWRDWLAVAPAGLTLFIGGTGFVALAEVSVSSGGAAVVCATMPLWVGVLGIFFGERPTAREWLTLVVGFAGVFILMDGPSLSGRPEHIVLIIVSPICWALGSLLSRRTKGIGGPQAALVVPGVQMLMGGVVLLVIALGRGEPLPIHASARSWLALAYLVVFGSLVAFTGYAWLLRNARPVVATSYAYVNPVIAVLLGAALYGEPLGWTTLVANILIVGAVMLALMRPRLATP
ncbi:MAG: Permease of the drug/metabolite transporter superfamily [Myxococcales bacterium]|nr:Permease of the drug/metabolite transporter superfamily [Myxococcales bacterium]